MIISVTEKDIKEGNDSCDACPITIALRRRFGNKVSVSRNYIRVLKKRKSKVKWHFISLPIAARNFLIQYYKHYPFKPFAFELSKKDVKILKAAM